MVKKISAIIAVVIALVCVFAACGGTVDSSTAIVGTWVGEEEGLECTYTFNADGTGKGNVMAVDIDITYEINGELLTLNIDTSAIL